MEVVRFAGARLKGTRTIGVTISVPSRSRQQQGPPTIDSIYFTGPQRRRVAHLLHDQLQSRAVVRRSMRASASCAEAAVETSAYVAEIFLCRSRQRDRARIPIIELRSDHEITDPRNDLQQFVPDRSSRSLKLINFMCRLLVRLRGPDPSPGHAGEIRDNHRVVDDVLSRRLIDVAYLGCYPAGTCDQTKVAQTLCCK